METAFVLKYGEHEPTRNDEAWHKIETEVGAFIISFLWENVVACCVCVFCFMRE